MTRVHSVTEEKASPKVKFIYDLLQKKLGRVPNIFLNMGNAPAVLEGYLALSDAANHTSLSPKIREQIALVVGQTNQCNYCLSAHSAIAGSLGLKQEDILSARKGKASSPKDQAILQFAKKMVENRGHMKDAEIIELKNAGVDDEEMLEIVMLVSLNIFTNYFNHLTDPVLDFPEAPKSI
jgi:uncharacterized peroxidase-related enzyme